MQTAFIANFKPTSVDLGFISRQRLTFFPNFPHYVMRFESHSTSGLVSQTWSDCLLCLGDSSCHCLSIYNWHVLIRSKIYYLSSRLYAEALNFVLGSCEGWFHFTSTLFSLIHLVGLEESLLSGYGLINIYLQEWSKTSITIHIRVITIYNRCL